MHLLLCTQENWFRKLWTYASLVPRLRPGNEARTYAYWHFEWLILNNSHGQCGIWLACETTSDRASDGMFFDFFDADNINYLQSQGSSAQGS